MKPSEKILIENCLGKSNKALQDAYANIEVSLSVAQNRAYYAVFYIVLALGYIDGFVTGKHHQLMGWFNKKYIYQDKVFDSSLAKIYNTLMINREKSDYDVTQNPTREDVMKDVDSAKVFIEAVMPYIHKRLEEIP